MIDFFHTFLSFYKAGPMGPAFSMTKHTVVFNQTYTAVFSENVCHLMCHVVGTWHGEAYNTDRCEFALWRNDWSKLRILTHAAKMGENATGFINRAIDETMKRDNHE